MWWDVSGMSIIIHSSLQIGWSSLMMACGKGHAEVVRILVSAGAHVNDQNEVSTYGEREGKVGGGSGRTYGKGRRGRRWQGDDPIRCSSVGVSSVT